MKTYRYRLRDVRHLKTMAIVSLLSFGTIFFSALANAQTLTPQISVPSNFESLDIEALKIHLSSFHRSAELVAEIDSITEKMNESTPVATRIQLDLWKLRALADISDTQASATFAYEIYSSYNRQDYVSDHQYGDTMQQIVQAVTKTDQLGLAFEIVQHLRESVYRTPNVYLNFIIDKSLMEIYIETFDYQRALDIELSILGNDDYTKIEIIRQWRPSLYNEIAFVYNRLGNGEKALEYLSLAKDNFEIQNLNRTDLLKARALNAGNRGRAYLLTGSYDQVEALGISTMEAGQELQQNYLIALGYRLRGSAAYHQGEFLKAIPLLETGISLSQQHGIATMQKFLYQDYALCLEALGHYEAALFWQKKHFALELIAQEHAASARDALNVAEFEAFETHQEIVRLKHENIDQRKMAERDKRIKNLLIGTVLSLILGAGILASLMGYMRIIQKRLIASENKAQIANKTKSEFLANMSHEIRTPMNGVLGMAQVLERTPLSDKQQFYINIMKRSGENLLFILNDILDFSKLEAEKLTLNLESGNLEQTLQDVVALLTSSTQNANLELRYDFDPDIPKHYEFDEGRVRQILTNLIGNAVKFTKEGYVHVGVSGQAHDGQMLIKIRIKDTGIGIEPDKISMIFEEFTQAESSTTRTYGGTGLGLSISRRLSEFMGGSLEVTSTAGEGSVFTLELPLEVAKATSGTQGYAAQSPQINVVPIEAAASEQQLKKSPLEGNSLNILVAEDDPIQVTVMQGLLNHPRIKLTFTENGADAVEAYRSKAFNIIFMDVSMPVMDGVSATKAIRDIEIKEGLQRTPIICLSAHATVWQKQKRHQTEIDGYLAKPVNREKLYETLQFWLKTRKIAA